MGRDTLLIRAVCGSFLLSAFSYNLFMYRPFKTKRHHLTLRPLEVGDAATYFKLLDKNRDHMNHAGAMGETRQQTLADVIRNIEQPLNPKKTRFGVWDGDTIVGMMSLVHKTPDRCEVGGWIGKKYTKQGYAADALRSLCQKALGSYGYSRIIATTYPKNIASQRWLENVGFTRTRRFPKRYYFAFDK